MATEYIPPARALMLSPNMPTWVRWQHPLALMEGKDHTYQLHVYPDWYYCSRKYKTTYARRWGTYGIFKEDSFTDSWRDPFEEELDRSENTHEPFEITPVILIVFKSLFAKKDDPEAAFKSFVDMAEEVWGTPFKYSNYKDSAYAICPSDATHSDSGSDPFVDKVINGSICFCTKMDVAKMETDGYNYSFKEAMLAKGHKVCYIVCEVNPEKLKVSYSSNLQEMCPEDDVFDDYYSGCIKGLKMFGSNGEEIDMAEIEGNQWSISLKVAYFTLPLNNPDAPIMHGSSTKRYVRIKKRDKTNWPKGELPASPPMLDYTAKRGELTKKIAVSDLRALLRYLN